MALPLTPHGLGEMIFQIFTIHFSRCTSQSSQCTSQRNQCKSWLNIEPKFAINRNEKDNFKQLTQDILDLFKKAKKIYLRFITHEPEAKKSLFGETF